MENLSRNTTLEEFTSCVTREGVSGLFCPNFRIAKELGAQTRASMDSTTPALAGRMVARDSGMADGR